MIDRAKSNYFRNLLNINKNNPKKFWRTIKSFTDNTSKNTVVPNLVDPHTHLIIPNDDSPDYLNNYFVNIVDRLNIIDPNNNYGYFENLYTVDDELCFLNDPPTEAEVLLHSANIDMTKSSGVLDVNIRQCKDILECIPEIICCIYVTSIRTGIFPPVWSRGLVSLIPKQGSLTDPGNWRPITQTSIFAKIFEKIIYRRLYDHLDVNNIFSKFQYGFLPNRSTQTATFDLTKHIYSALNNKKIFGSACLDVSKAFDCVNHRLLLYKLRSIGLSDTCITWFSSYLHRSQSVLFDNKVSSVKANVSGIGQGTILGPILFILYINDIVNHLGDVNINMYADDCVLYCTGNSWDRVQSMLQRSLSNITEWFKFNALKLNVKKSKCLIISSKAKLGLLNRGKKLFTEGQVLEFVDSYNYLGYILDSEMSLKPLLSHVKKIVTSKIKTLYKIRKYLDNHSAIAIYKQMILPLFDYSGFVLLSCNKTDREDLQTIQNNTLRHCLGLRLNDRVSLSDIHLQANLLSLEQRRCIQLLSLLFMHGKSHENVFEIPARQTRAANIPKYKTEIYKNSKYKNSPYYKAAKLWDTLPRAIKDSDTIGELKHHLKLHFPRYVDDFYLT